MTDIDNMRRGSLAREKRFSARWDLVVLVLIAIALALGWTWRYMPDAFFWMA